MDIRSGDDKEIKRLSECLLKAVNSAVRAENERWHVAADDHTKAVRAEIIEKGNRPGGAQSPDDPIILAACEAVKAVGLEPSFLGEGSTDSNIPISLGIPAVTVGMGGKGGGEHTTGEWYRPDEAWKGVQKNMLLILSLAGLNL
ncbi:hypothetical protein [Clostridium sp. AM58-1XD]|uniref:hypothetical protein n=1 Tax=Clostridium sp. AM58-1XD TaxID=2292307 RepID=UPI0011C1533D|nr:hypothetical protein [Clostridium sp. AM58-1XD]